MPETVPCTICAAEESPGFYTGCMVKDGHAPEWDCDGKGNLRRKETAMSEAIVIEIDVENGMVQQVKAPTGVTVKINDYDVFDVGPDDTKHDINGAEYVEITVEGTGDWEDAV